MMEVAFSSRLRLQLQEIREQLVTHEAYPEIRNVEQLHVFMEHHVYAVWDFMSLLKALQIELTCVELPWMPKGRPETRYFINEIVLGEESDIDSRGGRISHFELYLRAMKSAGANTEPVLHFIESLKQGHSLEESIEKAKVPAAAAEFMRTTFGFIRGKKPHVLSAVFTYGREDLIPDMFLSILKQLQAGHESHLEEFRYYIERHIEVDGEEHGLLATQMTEDLLEANPDYLAEALEACQQALRARLNLWNGIVEEMRKTAVI